MNVTKLFDLAILNRDFGTVMHLVLNGQDVHYRDDYALRRAAEYGDMTAVLFLLEQDANIYARNHSAICWAAQNGHTEIVKYLLENYYSGQINDIPRNIILYAIDSGSIEMIRIFRKASFEICTKDSMIYAITFPVGIIKYILRYGTVNDLKYFEGLVEKFRADYEGNKSRKCIVHEEILEWIYLQKRMSWFSHIFSGVQ